MAGSLRVKLLARGKALTPYVARVSKSGWVQKAFAEQIGRPVGQCVAGSVRRGMGQGAIKRAVAECARPTRGVRLHRGGAGLMRLD